MRDWSPRHSAKKPLTKTMSVKFAGTNSPRRRFHVPGMAGERSGISALQDERKEQVVQLRLCKVARIASICFMAASWLVVSLTMAASGTHAPGKRPVTVADVIAMTRVAESAGSNSWQEGAPISSPNGKHVAVVLRKGNLKRNTNVYSLFVLERNAVLRHPAKKLLVSFSSSSNRAAVKQLTWRSDNDSILFLGERPGQLTQLYEIRSSTRRLTRLTNHSTNVTSYSAAASGGTIVYATERPRRNLVAEDIRKHGFHVPENIDLSELIEGHILDGASDRYELFVRGERPGKYQPLKVSGRLLFPELRLFVSPDGKHLAIRTLVRQVDPSWKDYEDSVLQMVMNKNLPEGSVTFVERYELVDLERAAARALIDAPIGYSGSELMWSPDSQSVIVTGVHLPLDVSEPKSREARQAGTFVAEVKIAGGEIIEVTDRNLKLVGWDPQTGLWKFETRQEHNKVGEPPPPEYFRKRQGAWSSVGNVSQVPRDTGPEIIVEEDLNQPPRIVAESRGTNRRAVIVDLNPQFASLSFGKVEDLRWSDAAAHEFRGGLYLPANYQPGKRYPLVIQTHGYHSHEFWIDGPYTTAFAAQPLASKGIAVLQLPELAAGTSAEGDQNMRVVESAIDFLDRKGMIDRARVGLIGFSRTCYHVKYALTQSKIHFAAASVTDGVDAGYLQYAIFANESPYNAADAETLVGGSPFGEGLSLWLKKSPGFLLNRVDTPILVQAIGPGSLLGEWEWFSGLTRLDRAVDFLYIPAGTHILEKPWDRMASQQTNVDWFSFWLKGDEDADPVKAEQYMRWRKLREKQAKVKVRGQEPSAEK